MGVVADAVIDAPTGAAVYFFLGPNRELLYVGKAGNLRRRLAEHARASERSSGRRANAMFARVRSVRWETCSDEDTALIREADLIVYLRPRFNASHKSQGKQVFIAVDDSADRVTFDLTDTVDATGRTYGSFAHVAKGSFSQSSKRIKAGYTALLRLLWVTQPGPKSAAIPRRLAGASPPAHHASPVPDLLRPLLDDYLAGRSVRLLLALRGMINDADLPDFMRPNLTRDRAAAHDFFELASQRVHRLRVRHGLADRPVTGMVMTKVLRQELAELIGDSSSTSLH